MEPIHVHAVQHINRSVSVIDGPVLPYPGSTVGRRFRLYHFTVTFTLIAGEWRPTMLVVRGPALKADGTDGRATFNGRVSTGRWTTDPEWETVRKIIEGMCPTGSADLPFGPFDIETTDSLHRKDTPQEAAEREAAYKRANGLIP